MLNKIKNIIIIIALLLSTTACHADKRFYPAQQKHIVVNEYKLTGLCSNFFQHSNNKSKWNQWSQKQRVDAIKTILIEAGLVDEKQDIVKYPKIAEHMILGEFAIGMTKAEANCVNTLHHYRKKNSIDNIVGVNRIDHYELWEPIFGKGQIVFKNDFIIKVIK